VYSYLTSQLARQRDRERQAEQRQAHAAALATSTHRAQPPAQRHIRWAVHRILWGTTYVITTELLPQEHRSLAGVLRGCPRPDRAASHPDAAARSAVGQAAARRAAANYVSRTGNDGRLITGQNPVPAASQNSLLMNLNEPPEYRSLSVCLQATYALRGKK
jgi:hypothetical protein